ncbi:MAG: hypothetical protein A2Y86_08395 [Candidatus Aminicenantes bacterium RBG_13_62_12]|nr:MAG: hypothetical protein A2Y86_08395 [Candidatus Aminicenantes bacterium RBG_13_62_12]
MKKTLIPLLLVAFVLFSLGMLNSAQSQEDAKFRKALDTYLDAYWKFYPTAGTLAGYTKYNDKLEDFSSKAVEKRNDELDTLNQDVVTKVNRANLSPENQIDHEILVDALELDLFRHENIVPWEYNPLFYADILANCVSAALGKNSAPIDTRVKNATERLKQIPNLVKQARENLKTPAQVYTETAINQMPGILDIYRNQLSALASGASADARNKFSAEIPKAVAALEAFQGFLKGELLARSTGNFRLGDQAHMRLLRLTTYGSLILDEVVARARADYNNIRRDMALVCIPFYKVMYPEVDIEQMNRPEEELRNIIIKGVFDKIKIEHPDRNEFVTNARPTAENIRSFIKNNNLLALPEEMPAIQPMPLEKQGVLWTRLEGPGAYESDGSYVVTINPIPADWPPDKVTSFLEEYNDYIYPFWVVRNVYPGSYVPMRLAWNNSTLMRKLHPNMPLIKGWPMYLEEMLITSGYGNYDLRLRLSQLEMQLKAAIDFQLDLNIHQGGMTKEQAVNYMTRGGFQSEAEAERKWNRIILNPGEAAYTYLGYQEILDMEKDYKRLKGSAFKQGEFLQKLLSQGALPIRLLKARLAQ